MIAHSHQEVPDVFVTGQVHAPRPDLAGDSSYTEELMRRQAIDGVAPDEGAARETLRRINDLADDRPLVYLPSHDPDGAARLDARQTVPQ